MTAFCARSADHPAVADAVAPAAPASPKQLTTEDFFRPALMTNAKISPDGKYVGVLVPDGNSTKLVILDMATMDPTAGYNIADGEFIDDFNWINNHQVVWDAAKRMGPLSRTYAMGHLTIGNAESSKASSFDLPAYFAGRIRDAPDWILVEYREALYRWNIKTHAEKPVDEIPYGESNYLVDHSGKLRFVTGTDSADLVTAIRGEDGGGWKELHRASMSGGDMEPIAFSSDDHRVYVESDVDAPTRGIYEIDTATNESKLLFRDDGVDSDDVLIEPGTDEPAGVLTFPDYPAYHFFDPSSRTAQTYAALEKAFPNSIIKLTSASDDGKFCTVAIGSDTKPVALYLLDLEAHNVSPLLETKPWIDPAQMSPMKPFTMKARDGVELHGYLTLPRQSNGKNLPLVVLPHGGPHWVRDLWGWDSEVQFLAYHGYAVLQVNFRGSGGYGREFLKLGFQRWGTTMQDDVTDATRWAIDSGVADAHRICIYGTSYGGYAAIMGTVREPDLYQCAIGYAGPYDLTMQSMDSDTALSESGQAYFKETLGLDKNELKARSPVYNVDKIKVPLLLIHGEGDQRVPIGNMEELAKALTKAGKPYETLVKKNEGHGFYRFDNKVEAYNRILAFLDKNIGKDRQVPAVAAAAVAVGDKPASNAPPASAQ